MKPSLIHCIANTGRRPTSGGRSNVGSRCFILQPLPPNFYWQPLQTRPPGGGGPISGNGARPGGALRLDSGQGCPIADVMPYPPCQRAGEAFRQKVNNPSPSGPVSDASGLSTANTLISHQPAPPLGLLRPKPFACARHQVPRGLARSVGSAKVGSSGQGWRG